MFKISQKLDYTCRVLIQLQSAHKQGLLMSADEIAKKELIPSAFLGQILHELRKQNIVQSRRGKDGGYKINPSLKTITLLDVSQALGCVQPYITPEKKGISSSITQSIWSELEKEWQNKLANITIEQLSTTSNSPLYYI